MAAQAQRSFIRGGLAPVRFLTRCAWPVRLYKTSLDLKALALAQHVITSPRQLVRQRFGRHDRIALLLFAFVKALRLRTVAQREVRRLHKGLGEIWVAILAVAFTLFLAIAHPQALHATAVRAEVTHLHESLHRTYLEHDGGR